MVLIASDIAGGSSLYFFDRMREAIPDRFALAVLVPRPFDLVWASVLPFDALCQLEDTFDSDVI
jgi:hypothetical protein